MKNVKTNLKTYESLLLNYNNVYDLYQKYNKENGLLKKDISITSNDIITNNRKSIYENQMIDQLEYWYGWIRFCYILIIVGYLIGLFLLPYDTPKLNYVIIFILLCIYPFIINPIMNWLLSIYRYFLSLFQ